MLVAVMWVLVKIEDSISCGKQYFKIEKINKRKYGEGCVVGLVVRKELIEDAGVIQEITKVREANGVENGVRCKDAQVGVVLVNAWKNG